MIFVFGSNLAGRHGKGAAKTALLHYRAIYGQAEGPQGASYAIPTMDAKLQTLHLSEIGIYVRRFITYAQRVPGYDFQITRIGCGLAGYSDAEMAELFDRNLPRLLPNLWFDEAWRPYLKEGTGFWGTFSAFAPVS